MTLFKQLDGNSDGAVDRYEFYQLCNTVLQHTPDARINPDLNTFYGRMQEKVLRFCFKYSASGELTLRTRFHNPFVASVFAQFFTTALYGTVENGGLLDLVNFSLMLIQAVVVLAKIVAWTPRLYWRHERYDGLVMVPSFCFAVMFQLLEIFVEPSLLKFRRIAVVLPIFKAFTIVKSTRVILSTFLGVAPVFAEIAYLLFTVSYFFAVAGVYFFRGALTKDLSPDLASFEDMQSAMLTLFQLFTGSNWHEVMYSAKNQHTAQFTQWYFIMFSVIITLFLNSLFVGIVLDAFVAKTLVAESKREEEQLWVSHNIYLGAKYQGEQPVCYLCAKRVVDAKGSGSFLNVSCDHKFHQQCLLGYTFRRGECPACRAIRLFGGNAAVESAGEMTMIMYNLDAITNEKIDAILEDTEVQEKLQEFVTSVDEVLYAASLYRHCTAALCLPLTRDGVNARRSSPKPMLVYRLYPGMLTRTALVELVQHLTEQEIREDTLCRLYVVQNRKNHGGLTVTQRWDGYLVSSESSSRTDLLSLTAAAGDALLSLSGLKDEDEVQKVVALSEVPERSQRYVLQQGCVYIVQLIQPSMRRRTLERSHSGGLLHVTEPAPRPSLTRRSRSPSVTTEIFQDAETSLASSARNSPRLSESSLTSEPAVAPLSAVPPFASSSLPDSPLLTTRHLMDSQMQLDSKFVLGPAMSECVSERESCYESCMSDFYESCDSRSVMTHKSKKGHGSSRAASYAPSESDMSDACCTSEAVDGVALPVSLPDLSTPCIVSTDEEPMNDFQQANSPHAGLVARRVLDSSSQSLVSIVDSDDDLVS